MPVIPVSTVFYNSKGEEEVISVRHVQPGPPPMKTIGELAQAEGLVSTPTTKVTFYSNFEVGLLKECATAACVLERRIQFAG
eukprot:1155874-Pelagomonas_calceolata.AAC.1